MALKAVRGRLQDGVRVVKSVADAVIAKTPTAYSPQSGARASSWEGLVFYTDVAIPGG